MNVNHTHFFLGTFARKALINCVMSVRPSVRMYQRSLPLGTFSWNSIRGTAAKFRPDSPVVVKIGQQYRERYMEIHSLDCSTKCFVTRQQCKGNPFITFPGRNSTILYC